MANTKEPTPITENMQSRPFRFWLRAIAGFVCLSFTLTQLELGWARAYAPGSDQAAQTSKLASRSRFEEPEAINAAAAKIYRAKRARARMQQTEAAPSKGFLWKMVDIIFPLALTAAVLLMLAFPESQNANTGFKLAAFVVWVGFPVQFVLCLYWVGPLGKSETNDGKFPGLRISDLTRKRLVLGPSIIFFDESLWQALKKNYIAFVTLFLMVTTYTFRILPSLNGFYDFSRSAGWFSEIQHGRTILFGSAFGVLLLANQYLSPVLTALHELGHFLLAGPQSRFVAESMKGETIHHKHPPMRSFFIRIGGSLVDVFLIVLGISVLLVDYPARFHTSFSIVSAITVSFAAYVVVHKLDALLSSFLIPFFFWKSLPESDGSEARDDLVKMNVGERFLAITSLISVVTLLAAFPFVYLQLPALLTGVVIPSIASVLLGTLIFLVRAESGRKRFHEKIVDRDASVGKKDQKRQQNDAVHPEILPPLVLPSPASPVNRQTPLLAPAFTLPVASVSVPFIETSRVNQAA